MNDIVGDIMGLVMYYFDSKNFGESLQRPDLRYPPLREKEYFRLAKAVLDARHPTPVTAGGTSNLGVGEVAVLLDGSKSGICRNYESSCTFPCSCRNEKM